MKKLLLALTLAAAAVTSHAQVTASQQNCEDYGHIVGSMQVIRNNGGPIGLAHNDLRNLTTATDRSSREFGRSLTEIAEYIWSKPVNNLTRQSAERAGTEICTKNYRK
jgi:hypothetical protein